MRLSAIRAVGVLAASGALFASFTVTTASAASPARRAIKGTLNEESTPTKTPIQHLVVIFDENVSFDHYFGTYPYATNPPGEPTFNAKPGTPTVNGLYNDISSTGVTGPLLTANPNGSNPERLDRSDDMTCGIDNDYSEEQKAYDQGAVDNFPSTTGESETLAQCLSGMTLNGQPEPVPANASSNYVVMDYYDGNTVTALWNYAQQYAMDDNMFGTTYGPSTPGATNVTSANTYGMICGPSDHTINAPACGNPSGYDATDPDASHLTTAGVQTTAGPGTNVSADSDPSLDICSYLPGSQGGEGDTPDQTIVMGGPNIGTELDAANVTWGWFEGGFDDGYVPGHGTPPTVEQICSEQHTNLGGQSVVDYIPHHEPFQYYAATANPMHLPPTSVAAIGHQDQANHQYDIADFWAAADQGNLPAVSYLKAPAYEDGNSGYSDPLDEQRWLVDTINSLESLKTWSSTAIIITWDDSNGWYDHVMPPLLTQSQTSYDFLTGTSTCGSNVSDVPKGSTGQAEQGRCGLGPRLPFLVISPYAKSNFVDNTQLDQSSVVKFIEYNWNLPALGNGAADSSAGSILSMFDFDHPTNQALFLNASTGEPVPGNSLGQLANARRVTLGSAS